MLFMEKNLGLGANTDKKKKKKPTNLIAGNIMLLLGESGVRAIDVFQNTLPVNS